MHHSDPPSSTHFNAWQHWAFRVEQRIQEQEDIIHRLQAEIDLLKQQLNREQQAPPTIHVDKIEYHFDQLKVDTLEGSLQIGLSTSNPEQLPMMIEDIMMKQQQANGTSQVMNPSQPIQPAQGPFMHKYNKEPNTKLNDLQQKFNHSNASIRKQQKQKNVNESTNNLQTTQDGQAQVTQSELANQYLVEACNEMLHNELNQRFKQYIERQGSLYNVSLNEDHIQLVIQDIARQLPARIHHYIKEQQAKHSASSSEQVLEQVMSLTRKDIEEAIDQYIYQLSIKGGQ